MSGAKPVTVGQGYSTIAIIPETEGSWALPLLHERITSFSNPIEKLPPNSDLSAKFANSPTIYVGCGIRLCLICKADGRHHG